MSLTSDYETIRQSYKPANIKFLMIAESPPPPPDIQSSRQFYYTDRTRQDDRLFTNTIRALYPKTAEMPEKELEMHKKEWLEQFKSDGWYMIEALQQSQPHEVTKKQRQEKIKQELPRLIRRVSTIADKNTKLILIKSNVFDVAAEPLRRAGFTVLNTRLLDYPGHFNQKNYQIKLAKMIKDL